MYKIYLLRRGCKWRMTLYFTFALIMLNEEEKRFVAYWEQNRNRKKRMIWQLAAGLPLAVLLSGGIFITYFSRWYTRAVMMINWSTSGVLVVFVALVGIVVFVVTFSSRHRWEMHEQRYRELMSKEKNPG